MKISEWEKALLKAVDTRHPDAQAALDYLSRRRVRIGFRRMKPHIGAIWLPGRRMFFNAAHISPQGGVTAEAVSLFLHEVCHLRQGIFTALSVYGELEAWQCGFRYLYDHLQRPYPPPLDALMALPLEKDRDVLRQARALMQAYAGKAYRADLLPLFPWGDELRWQLWERWRRR